MAGLDFLVIGAQKSATTTLWHLLRDHPQLALPFEKEAPLFTDDARMALGLEAYIEAHFPGVEDGVLRGTITPQYMTGVTGPNMTGFPIEEVVRRIAEWIPEVKLIAILREPIERAVSHHRMSARRGIERRPLGRALAEQLSPVALEAARNKPTETNGYLAWGEYGRILTAFRGKFPSEQFLVLFTDDLERDPGATLGRIFEFVGVQAAWRPQDLHLQRFKGSDTARIEPEEATDLLSVLNATLPEVPRETLSLAVQEWNSRNGDGGAALEEALRHRLQQHFAADARLLESAFELRVPWRETEPARPGRRGRRPAPAVSIVMLVHNTPLEARLAMESIARYTPGSYEVVVVDNGSDEATAQELTALSKAPTARLVRLEENAGYSAGNNAGLAVATGKEVVLLNSDVVVTPEWLKNLQIALRSAPDVVAVGPRSNFARGQQGGIWLDDTTPEGIDRFGRFFNRSDPSRWFEIDWLMGYAILARRESLTEIGGFDETIPDFGGEDEDLCRRLTAAGGRLLCAGDTFIFHTGHRTFHLAGINRTVTRLKRGDGARPPAPPIRPPRQPGELVRDARGWVFEVRGGVAYHIETGVVQRLIKANRRTRDANPDELEGLPLGAPVSLCRARGTEDVWVLHCGRRRRVTGDAQRIRRLLGVAVVDPADLDPLPEGGPVDVESAVPPIPDMKPLLPSNPAVIDPERLVSPKHVADDILAALKERRGFSLIRLEGSEAVLLSEGSWPVTRPLDLDEIGVRASPQAASRLLREAIIGADAVGVAVSRDVHEAADLLEQVLFHFDLYPPLRCASDINFRLLGIDPQSREETGGSLLGTRLRGRRVAVVCPAALASSLRPAELSHRLGYDVGVVTALDDLSEIHTSLLELATYRDRFDVVLVAGDIPAKILCSRLARGLNCVAIDVGHALDERFHALYNRQSASLVATRWSVAAYLREAASEQVGPSHPLDGSLIRVAGTARYFYVERGRARRVAPALRDLFKSPPVDVDSEVVTRLLPGAPVCAVQGNWVGPVALIDGKRVPVGLGTRVVNVDDFQLLRLPVADGSDLVPDGD